MKRVSFSILLAAVLCLMGTKAQAYDFSQEYEGVTIYYNYINNGTELEVTYKTTSSYSYSGDVAIPEEVTFENNTLRVTSIGMYAFSGCNSLTSVTIGSGVTSIGILPFSGCNSLSSVYISDLDTWCKITFFNQESNPLYFAHHLFLNGEEIQELVIPNSVTSIGNYAFYRCSSLTSVTIPNSVTSIGNAAFGECSGLTSVSIPSSVTSIGDNNFAGCTGLTSVSIPNRVTSIGMNAFGSCTGLTSITIPNSVTSIGQWAFRNCSELTSVTIGSGVTSIGGMAFDGCDIPEVISKIEEPFAIDAYTFSANTFYNATLYVPEGTIDAYKATEGWKKFKFIEERERKKCATPTISFVNGEVVFACETEGVEFVPTVTCVPQQLSGNKLKLGST